MERNCSDCMHWERLHQSRVGVGIGHCRKAPPVIIQSRLGDIGEWDKDGTDIYRIRAASLWPKTIDTDYCGDFRRAVKG